MNISLNSLFSSSVPLLKETVTHALNDQQKKIMAVALLVFSLLAIAYFACPRLLEASSNVPNKSPFSPLTDEIDSSPVHQHNTPEYEGTIYFYNKGEPYYELTNFYENWRKDGLHYVFYKGLAWKTAEHAFQAEKFNWDCIEAQVAREQIIRAPDARTAFKIAQQNKTFMRPGWHSIKDDIMLDVLRAKFQDEHLSNVLRKTGRRKVVEASPYDDYWGYGSDGNGQNRLGILVMQVRKERFGF